MSLSIVVPDWDAVRAFADACHKTGAVWQGKAFGGSAEYFPERAELPLHSKMTFTPADVVVDESGIWFFLMLWERGKDNPPVEFWTIKISCDIAVVGGFDSWRVGGWECVNCSTFFASKTGAANENFRDRRKWLYRQAIGGAAARAGR